jgi:hypothetical protein
LTEDIYIYIYRDGPGLVNAKNFINIRTQPGLLLDVLEDPPNLPQQLVHPVLLE